MKHLKKSSNKRNKIKTTRDKSREITTKSQTYTYKNEQSSSEEDDTELLQNLDKLTISNAELTTQDQEISFQDDLQPFEDTLTPDERKRNYTKKKTSKKSKNKKIKEREEKRKLKIIELIKTGDLNNLIAVFEDYISNNCEVESDADVKTKIINECLDESNNTPLHLGSFYEQQNVIEYLLENDANPCNKNTKLQTPYTITQNKEIREIFKKFAQENPNKYNYNKAHIPVVVLSAEEIAEKKRQQRKFKKEKEKERKKENQIRKQEEMEKQKFLQLSDTEKVVEFTIISFL